MVKYLIDTNILIYHTKGSEISITFLNKIIDDDVFTVSIITKIEFLGWHKHTPEGYKKCSNLIKLAKIYNIDDNIADVSKGVEIDHSWQTAVCGLFD